MAVLDAPTYSTVHPLLHITYLPTYTLNFVSAKTFLNAYIFKLPVIIAPIAYTVLLVEIQADTEDPCK